jgi:hypothetical protein
MPERFYDPKPHPMTALSNLCRLMQTDADLCRLMQTYADLCRLADAVHLHIELDRPWTMARRQSMCQLTLEPILSFSHGKLT